MTWMQVDILLTLFFAALWSGGIFIFAVERTNLWARMPIDQFAVDFRRSLLRVDPMMPILGLLTAAGGIIFALNEGGGKRLLAWAGVGFVLVVIIGSVAIAEPMNSKFRRLPEGTLPPDAERLRAVWRRFHAARNVASLISLVCLIAAAVL